MFRACFVLSIALSAAPVFAGPADDAYQDALGRLVSELHASLPEEALLRHRTLAMDWFICGGESTAESRYRGVLGECLGSDIERLVLRAGKFRVVGRERMSKLLEEQDFWLSPMVAKATVPEAAAKFLAATLLLQGKYFVDGPKGQVKVDAEIVEVDSGRKLTAASVLIPLVELPVQPDDKELGLARRMSDAMAAIGQAVADVDESAAKHSGDDRQGRTPLRARVWVEGNKPFYNAGEELRLKVQVDQDAYVVLLAQGPDGEIQCLFPNRFHRDYRVRGGELLTVPSDDMGFSIVVRPPYGPESVQAIACADAAALKRAFPAVDRDDDAPFASIGNDAAAVAANIRRSLEAHAARDRLESDPGDRSLDVVPRWAEARVIFLTRPSTEEEKP